jgi:protein disulfide-isomerase A6
MTGFAKGASKKEPVDYNQGRSEIDLIRFVNENAGTYRLEGGGLSDDAGHILDLDELAKKLAVATTDAEEGYVYDELQQVLAKADSPYATL